MRDNNEVSLHGCTIGIYEKSGVVARCRSDCESIGNSSVICGNFSTEEQCARILPTCTTHVIKYNSSLVILIYTT